MVVPIVVDRLYGILQLFFHSLITSFGSWQIVLTPAGYFCLQ
jgi:hypothetical protein